MRRRDFVTRFGGLALTPVVARVPGAAAIGAAREATPAVATGDGSLAAILALAPDVLAGGAPQFQITQYANPTLQLDTVGITPPESIADDESVSQWVRANWWMALPTPMRTQALLEDWRIVFGFDAFQVDQSIVVGEPPAAPTIYRGRFDVNELRAAWTASGYTEVDIDGAEAYSFSEDDSIDLSSPVGQLALAQMNNAAILPDGTLLPSPILEGLRTMVAAATGEAPTLAEQPEVASLTTTLDPDVVSAYLIPGDTLRATPTDILGERGSPEQIAAIEEAMAEVEGVLAPMPRPRLAAIAVTAGGPLPQLSDESLATPMPETPLAHDLIALVMNDRAAAEAAIPIVEARLANGMSFVTNRPYTDYFTEWTLTVAKSEPVLLIDLTPATDSTPAIVLDLLNRRDLLFVGWRDDNATPST